MILHFMYLKAGCMWDFLCVQEHAWSYINIWSLLKKLKITVFPFEGTLTLQQGFDGMWMPLACVNVWSTCKHTNLIGRGRETDSTWSTLCTDTFIPWWCVAVFLHMLQTPAHTEGVLIASISWRISGNQVTYITLRHLSLWASVLHPVCQQLHDCSI